MRPERKRALTSHTKSEREITYRTRGHGEGFIARLMSPSDLGEYLKPFVFLDIFTADAEIVRAFTSGGGMPLHPHSGIATVTVITEGFLRFNDQEAGMGEIAYGGVEWMRAGSGVWHGKEMTPGSESGFQGFQLWLALPPELENGNPESRYIEAKDMRHIGPAYVIIGSYENVQSPVPAPLGINYLLVTLKPGERWIYTPPKGHSIGWLALAKGALETGDRISSGEMVLFENSEKRILLCSTGEENAVFVLGSAVPHPYSLHLGNYSVHTSEEALSIGEKRIVELGRRLKALGGRYTESGTIPVFR